MPERNSSPWFLVACLLVSANPIAYGEDIKWPKVGHEFRSGLTYDNGGFQDPEDLPQEKPSATMAVERMKLKLTGDLAEDVSFFIRLAFEPTAKNQLDYAMLRLKINPQWTVGSGRTWNHISGFEWPYSLTEYVGTGSFPMTQGATAVMSGYSKQTFELAWQPSPEGAVWKIQIVDDVKIITDANGERTSGGWYSTGNQPAATFQVQGPGTGSVPWRPMLQVASYDAGHSHIVTLGALLQNGPWLSFLHLAQDNQAQRRDGQKYFNRRRYLSGLVEYSAGEWTPFLRWQAFDIRQGNGDRKGNSVDVDDAASIDDNIASLSAGARWMKFSEKFMPYFGVATSRARFEQSEDAGQEKRRDLVQIKAGVMSKM